MSTQTKRAAPPPPPRRSPVSESRLTSPTSERRTNCTQPSPREMSPPPTSARRGSATDTDSPQPPRSANGRKRKPSTPPAGVPLPLGELHDDMLERVLARLPPSAYFRLRAVCRRWRAAASSRTFLHACARVPSRDPWFLMLPASASDSGPVAVAFDAAARTWTRCPRAAPGVPVAASGGLVLYRAPDTGELTVANPLTGASRALPSPPQNEEEQLQAIAMYGGGAGGGAGSSYRVALFTGDLPHLSMAVFDSSSGSWDGPLPLARKTDSSSSSSFPDDDAAAQGGAAGAEEDDEAVYFLSKSGDVVSTTMQRSACKQYSSVVVVPSSSPTTSASSASAADVVVYFLSDTGTVVACDTAGRAFAELPRIMPAYYSEYSVDVVACGGGKAYAVVLAEYLDTATLRVWEFAGGEWRQVAAMPPAMSHGFRGARADINCVGHGGRIMVCVAAAAEGAEGGASGGCFMCDVATNRWEELPEYVDGDGVASEFVAAFSFEPRVEIAV